MGGTELFGSFFGWFMPENGLKSLSDKIKIVFL